MQGIGVLSLVCCVISGLVFQAHGGYPSNWFYQDEGAKLHHPFREVRHHSGYRRPESRSSYGPLAPSESRASYGPRGPRGYGDRRPLSRYDQHRRPHRKPGQSKRYKPKPYKKKEKKCCPTTTARFSVTDAEDDSPLEGVAVAIDSNPPIIYVTDSNGNAKVEINKQPPLTLDYTASMDGFLEVSGSFTLKKACSVKSIPVAMTPIVDMDRVELQWAPGFCWLEQSVVEYDDDGTSCRTYWANMNGCSDTSLDLDPCGGENSPTTITWRDNTKRYLIFMFQSTESPPLLVNTMAEYRVYGSDGSVQIFPVPTTPADNDKRYWVLGCFDGELGLASFNLLNIFTDNPFTLPCTPLGLDEIIPPSATDNWVIDALAQDTARTQEEHHE